MSRTHLKNTSRSRCWQFLGMARRDEEISSQSYSSEVTTTPCPKTDATFRDMANFRDSGVARPWSTTEDTPSSSLLGLTEIGRYRGRRYS